jgi:hypothetical protein
MPASLHWTLLAKPLLWFRPTSIHSLLCPDSWRKMEKNHWIKLSWEHDHWFQRALLAFPSLTTLPNPSLYPHMTQLSPQTSPLLILLMSKLSTSRRKWRQLKSCLLFPATSYIPLSHKLYLHSGHWDWIHCCYLKPTLYSSPKLTFIHL